MIAEYLTSGVVLALVFFIGWRALGPEGLYRPGTTLVTAAWMAVMLVAATLAGSVAGLVAGRIQPRTAAVWGMAGLLLVVGWAMAAAHGFVDDPTGTAVLGDRSVADLSAFEASSESVAPVWFHALLALVQSGAALAVGRRTLPRSLKGAQT